MGFPLYNDNLISKIKAETALINHKIKIPLSRFSYLPCLLRRNYLLFPSHKRKLYIFIFNLNYLLRLTFNSAIISLCFLFVISYFNIGNTATIHEIAVGTDSRKNIPKR